MAQKLMSSFHSFFVMDKNRKKKSNYLVAIETQNTKHTDVSHLKTNAFGCHFSTSLPGGARLKLSL